MDNVESEGRCYLFCRYNLFFFCWPYLNQRHDNFEFFSVGVAESTSVLTCRPYMDCCLYLTQVAVPARPSAHPLRCVYKFSLQHRDTTRPKQESMKSGLLSVMLSLAVTAYCVPLVPTVAEVTVQDEYFAEVRTVSFIFACILPQHF